MNEFTIYCTGEQTKKAFRLGAPIEPLPHSFSLLPKDLEKYKFVDITNAYLKIPTAEQMIGWLEDMEIIVMFIPTMKDDKSGYTWVAHVCHNEEELTWIDSKDLSNLSHKEAILTAIDKALEFLSNDLIK